MEPANEDGHGQHGQPNGTTNWWNLSRVDQTLMTNIQSGQLDLIRDDCDRAFGVSDAESVGERAMRKK